MSTSAIYGINNTANGKWYIGQSIDASGRILGHIRRLTNGTHTNKHLQGAFSKYGQESFEYKILEECPVEMLNVREIAWIQYYHSNNSDMGYNLDGGGEANKSVSKETRQRLSLASRGRKFSAEHKAKISTSLKGRVLSEEHRKNIGLNTSNRPGYWRGKTRGPFSTKWKAAMSKSQKARQERLKTL